MQYELQGCMQPLWTNKLCRAVSPNRFRRRIIHVTNWMAGTILTSSPPYFFSVEDYKAGKWKLWTRETVWCLVHSQPRALPIRVTVCRFEALRSPLITIVGPHPALEHSVSIFRCINNIGTWSIWTVNHKGSFHISCLPPGDKIISNRL